MHGSSWEPTWTVLILKPHEPSDDRPVAALDPVTPKHPEATPRYGCNACGRLLLTGTPLVELKQRLKQRSGRDDVAIRCPRCRALNATSVARTWQGPLPDAPVPGARHTPARYHVSGARSGRPG